MAFSSLICKEVIAHPNNYWHYRDGNVCKITPHHMAGILSGEDCARLFQDGSRGASATYCIGVNGDIVGNVPEEFAPGTSSNYYNDHHAITIEVSNDEYGGNWHISDASWNSLVNLCVDICKRYGFRLVYDGTPNGSLTRHNMFANTLCPGPYLESRFQELANTVNARLDKETIKYEEISRKSIVLNKDANLWNFNYSAWNNAQAVKGYSKGTKIDNIVAVATNSLGAKYYVTEYSYTNGTTNGFNIADCDDYIEPKPEPTPEPKPEPTPTPEPTPEPKKDNIFVLLIKMLVNIIKKILKIK